MPVFPAFLVALELGVQLPATMTIHALPVPTGSQMPIRAAAAVPFRPAHGGASA